MKIDFEHQQSAHCESGVTSNLLRQSSGGKITEPLAFGIGAGLFFAHVPFISINNGPAIAFRTMPGWIFKRTCQSLGIPVVRKKFSSREKAEAYLNEQLNAGQPVGCQVGVYYLSYFPKEYRFHFNAHNLIVYGKEGDNYLISDPIMETSTTLSSYELERVRFAKGALAPKGQLYYTKYTGELSDDIIRRSKGIRFTCNKIKGWLTKLGLEKAKLYLAQLVRMQEEIGTGGGGFRYIYAAFLQEAYSYLPQPQLLEISKLFTQSGDLWRNAAVHAAGIYKGRLGTQHDFDTMGNYLLEIAELEKKAFIALKNIKWQT